jgi:hypothetical protein
MRIAQSRGLQQDVRAAFVAGEQGRHSEVSHEYGRSNGNFGEKDQRMMDLRRSMPWVQGHDEDVFRMLAIANNPSSILLLRHTTPMEQAMALGADGTLLLQMPPVHPTVLACVLAGRDGADIYAKFPEVFDATVIGIEYPSFSQYVEDAKTRYGSQFDQRSLRGVLQRFFRYDALNDEAAMVEQVTEDPGSYYYLPNKSKAVQEALVKSHPTSISAVAEPSEDLMLLAVNADPRAIKGIKKPTLAVQQAAIEADPTLFSFTENPTDETIRAALRINPLCIEKVNPKREDLALYAIECVQHLGNIVDTRGVMHVLHRAHFTSETVQLAAVKVDKYALESIRGASPVVELAAVSAFPSAIQYIKNPNAEVQIIALSKDPSLITSIKQPTPAAQYLGLAHADGIKSFKSSKHKFQIDEVEKLHPGIKACINTATDLGLNNSATAEMVRKFQAAHSSAPVVLSEQAPQ